MENQNEQVPTSSVEEDGLILPDGWTGEGDFFAWAAQNSEADELTNILGEADKTEDGTANSEEAPATGEGSESSEGPETGEGELPATETEPEIKSNTIKFEATVNHKKTPVELNESDLPGLYEKAYAVDKFRNKLQAKTAELEEAELVSKMLGYGTVKEMLAAARESYENTEVEKLVREKVHPTIARDTVARKIKELETSVAKGRKQAAAPDDTPTVKGESIAPGQRDFKPEVAELMEAYPELKGKQVPQEVVDAALKGKTLLVAYTQYLQRQMQADRARLQKENKTLKQNAEAAKRAPVRGVSKGSPTNETAEDPFLKGFNAF